MLAASVFQERQVGIAGGMWGLDLADLDGALDVVTAGVITWYQNNGAAAPIEYDVFTDHDRYLEVAPVDLDADGDVDLLVGGEPGIDWFENDGEGNFSLRTAVDLEVSLWGVEKFGTGDFDGDGDLDFLTSRYHISGCTEIICVGEYDSYHTVTAWYENDGNQNFVERPLVERVYVEEFRGDFFFHYIQPQAADMDGDGNQDIVLDYQIDQQWYEVGDTGLIPHTTEVAAEFQISRLVDLDGDQDADAIADSPSGKVWLKNDGSARFTAQPANNLDLDRLRFVGDADGDGDVDIVGQVADSAVLYWLENDGAANFTRHVLGESVSRADYWAIRDIDFDGDIDVVVSPLGSRILQFTSLAVHSISLDRNTTFLKVNDQIAVRGDTADLLSVDEANLGRFVVTGDEADNAITLDQSGGNVIPPLGIVVNGGGGTNTLRVIGGPAELDLTTGGNLAVGDVVEYDFTDSQLQRLQLDAAAVDAAATSGEFLNSLSPGETSSEEPMSTIAEM